MTGAVEFSSDSDSDLDSNESSLPVEVKHFQVDHSTSSKARSELLASVKVSTLSLHPSIGYRPLEPLDDSNKRDIRVYLERFPFLQKWGFVIVRCTYASDVYWTKYLEHIRDHVAHDLNFEEDAHLRDKLDIAVMEGPALDAVTWKQARDIFDAWALEEIKTIPAYSESWLKQETEDLHHIIGISPRSEFFIFADEASVNSVVNSGQAFGDIYAPGAYYFTVVATGLRYPRIVHAKEDGTPVKDYEATEGTHKALRQKFKANEYVRLYARCLNDSWPDILGDDGGGVARADLVFGKL